MPTFIWQNRPRGVEKGKRVTTLEEEKMVKQAVDDKKDWGREKELEADHRKVDEMVPRDLSQKSDY